MTSVRFQMTPFSSVLVGTQNQKRIHSAPFSYQNGVMETGPGSAGRIIVIDSEFGVMNFEQQLISLLSLWVVPRNDCWWGKKEEGRAKRVIAMRGKSLPKKRTRFRIFANLSYFSKISWDLSRYQDLLRFLLTHSEFFQVFLVLATESLLGHSY